MLQWKYWKDNIRFLAFYSQNEAFMKFKNFLENLYLGHLDTEVFRSLSDSKAEDQTLALIERFRDISQKFPASDLEKKGKVPKELLEDWLSVLPHQE